MGCIERRQICMTMEDLTDVDRMFGRHAQVNMDRIPAAYAGLVAETKKKCMEQITPAGVIRSVNISAIDGETVLLEDGDEGWRIDGGFMAELLRDSREALWFAATLQGFGELLAAGRDLMEQFFLEAWGSAYASRAGMFTADCARAMLRERGLHCTSSWEPGQHGFDIYNQKEAFSILEPQDIGLSLTPSMLMIPSKSVTGVFGIAEAEDKRELIPCDYCPLRDTCPSSYNVGPMGGVSCGETFRG